MNRAILHFIPFHELNSRIPLRHHRKRSQSPRAVPAPSRSVAVAIGIRLFGPTTVPRRRPSAGPHRRCQRPTAGQSRSRLALVPKHEVQLSLPWFKKQALVHDLAERWPDPKWCKASGARARIPDVGRISIFDAPIAEPVIAPRPAPPRTESSTFFGLSLGRRGPLSGLASRSVRLLTCFWPATTCRMRLHSTAQPRDEPARMPERARRGRMV